SKSGIYRVADNGSIAHRNLPDIAAGHPAKMQSDSNTKWLVGLTPSPVARQLEYGESRIQTNRGFGSFLVPRRPISQNRISNVFVDDTAGRVNNVASITKPVA